MHESMIPFILFLWYTSLEYSSPAAVHCIGILRCSQKVGVIWLPSLVALFGICLSCALCIPQCYKNKGLKTCTWVILFVFITLLTNVLWLFLVLNKFDDLSPSEWYCDNQDGLVPGTAEHDACKAKDLKGDLIPAFFYLAFDLYLSFEMYFWMRDANKDWHTSNEI